MRFIARILNKIAILFVTGIMILGYGMMIEPNLLRINSMETGTLTKGKFRVVQFSDTHLDNNYTIKDLEKLVRIINLQEPDIIVFTGDLIDSVDDSRYPEHALETLGRLDARLGKVAVFGNHDYGSQGYRYYREMMEAAGFEVLANEAVRYDAGGGMIVNVAGLDDALLGTPDHKKVSGLLTRKYFDILVMHEPDEIGHFEQDSYELALAGHSHGGQIRLPFIGEISTPPLAKEYVRGMYEMGDGRKLYVSSGIGTTTIPVRLMNIPEIAVIDVKL